MSVSQKRGLSTRRQLPPTPSCQCHALSSYKRRPQPVFRREAPEESLKELVDDIFRMGTAYLIRSGERIPPAEMAYFECLNELDDLEWVAPPRLEMGRLFDQFTDILDGWMEVKESGSRKPLEVVAEPNTMQGAEKQAAKPQKSESDHDTKVTSQDQPTVEQGVVPLIARKNTNVTAQQPNSIVRYITEDQLSTMGWKDLFKLARVRGVVHGPMMESRRELVKEFVEKFGVEIPIYENDGLPREFPSKHSTSRWACTHHGRPHRQVAVLQRH